MSTQQSDEPNLDMLNSVLEGVHEQIHFADSKAGFVAAFHAFMFGILFTQADQFGTLWQDSGVVMRVLWVVAVLAYLVASVVSLWYAIHVVIPQFGERAPECKVFFGHVVACYGRDHGRYAEEVMKMKPSDWARDVATQIVENSNIAKIKHERASRATRWSLAVLATAAFIAVLIAISSVSLATTATTQKGVTYAN